MKTTITDTKLKHHKDVLKEILQDPQIQAFAGMTKTEILAFISENTKNGKIEDSVITMLALTLSAVYHILEGRQ